MRIFLAVIVLSIILAIVSPAVTPVTGQTIPPAPVQIGYVCVDNGICQPVFCTYDCPTPEPKIVTEGIASATEQAYCQCLPTIGTGPQPVEGKPTQVPTPIGGASSEPSPGGTIPPTPTAATQDDQNPPLNEAYYCGFSLKDFPNGLVECNRLFLMTISKE